MGKNPLKNIPTELFLNPLYPPLEYTQMFSELKEFPHVSKDALMLVTSLLDLDSSKRLGTGKLGSRNIRKHAFYQGMDWIKLGREYMCFKHIVYTLP